MRSSRSRWRRATASWRRCGCGASCCAPSSSPAGPVAIRWSCGPSASASNSATPKCCPANASRHWHGRAARGCVYCCPAGSGSTGSSTRASAFRPRSMTGHCCRRHRRPGNRCWRAPRAWRRSGRSWRLRVRRSKAHRSLARRCCAAAGSTARSCSAPATSSSTTRPIRGSVASWSTSARCPRCSCGWHWPSGWGSAWSTRAAWPPSRRHCDWCRARSPNVRRRCR